MPNDMVATGKHKWYDDDIKVDADVLQVPEARWILPSDMAATGKDQDDDDDNDDDNDDVLHDPPGFARLADNAQRNGRHGWSGSQRQRSP